MDHRPAGSLDVLRRVALVVWTAVGVLALGWAMLWVGGRVGVVIRPLVLAVAIIYLLNPLVARLHGRGIHRLFASCLSYLAFLLILTVAGFFVIPTVADQARDFSDRFPEIMTDLGDQITELAGRVGLDVDLPALPTAQSVRDWLADPDNQELLREQLGPVFEITLGLLEGILIFVLAPVLAFYLLIDLPRVGEHIRDLIPPGLRTEAAFVGREMSVAIGGFVRGQLLVAFIVGILMSIGFLIIDLPFWAIIGLMSGFLNIIPFVGPWVGGALGAFAGLTTGTPSTALWAMLVAVIVQQVDNHFISPIVLRTTVKLHPVTIILALLAGGALAGFFGILVAVPVAAIAKILIGHLWHTRVLGESWEEAREELIEERIPPPDSLAGRLLDIDEEQALAGPGEEPPQGD